MLLGHSECYYLDSRRNYQRQFASEVERLQFDISQTITQAVCYLPSEVLSELWLSGPLSSNSLPFGVKAYPTLE